MTIIGIDPGLSGGIAIIDGRSVDTFGAPVPQLVMKPMPRAGNDFAVSTLMEILTRGDDRVCSVYLEAAQHIRIGPRLMAKPTSVLFRCQGIVEGICASLGLRLVVIPPKKWQLAMLGAGKGKTKDRAAVVAARLWPKEKIKKALVDAALIAEYGRRQENGAER